MPSGSTRRSPRSATARPRPSARLHGRRAPSTPCTPRTSKRARETGHQIARHHGLEVTILDELREIELFRDLPEGTALLDAVDPILLLGAGERFVRERRWDVYPFSETGEEFRHRVLMAVEGILATHAGERVVVACHGGVINAVAGSSLGTRRGHVLPAGATRRCTGSARSASGG